MNQAATLQSAAPAKPARRRFNYRRGLLIGAALLVVLLVAGFVFAKNLLCVETGPAGGEVIVVLGGESVDRAHRAAQLFQTGAARSVIVSGTGDGLVIREELMRGGVPGAAIEVEGASRTTKENAEFTAPLLKQRGVRRAILVTSWFHSRRALNSFRHFAPEIRFSSLPAYHHETLHAEATHVFQEYLKTVWYACRHGIAPWNSAAP